MTTAVVKNVPKVFVQLLFQQYPVTKLCDPRKLEWGSSLSIIAP